MTKTRTCHCLVKHAITRHERDLAVKSLDYAREIGDTVGIALAVSQLAGPCPARPTAFHGLRDGERRTVSGSSGTHHVHRDGSTLSCSCPSWRFQKVPANARTCKHLKAIQGEEAEAERLAVAKVANAGLVNLPTPTPTPKGDPSPKPPDPPRQPQRIASGREVVDSEGRTYEF